MRTLKVIQVLPTLDFGGIETHRYLMAKYNDRRRTDLIFCTFGSYGNIAREIAAMGYTVHTFDERARIPNLRLLFKLYRFFRAMKPDVVHACAAEANFHAILAAFFAGVPVRIAEEIGIPGQSRKARTVFRYVYALASAVIGVSKKVTEYLLGENGVDPSKVRLIYNPYDIDRFRESRPPDDKGAAPRFTILSVGRLVPEKNHAMLIDAFCTVHGRFPETVLHIAGDGPLLQTLQEKVSALQLEQSVRLLGFREDIPKLLQQCDLFVLPSKSEGLGIALIEAMASGVPVVGTDTGGIPEVIGRRGNLGWLVPGENPEAMAGAIAAAIRLSPREREAMGENARTYVREKFSPYSYMEQLNNLYAALFAANASGRQH
jgi:glycosyltransferase involved in cell wall biosynthesis